MNRALRLVALALCISSLATAVSATDLELPNGPIVLTVDGAIAVTNAEDTAQFDMETLRSLPASSFVTTTIWTDGDQTFEGVSLANLMDLLGVDGGSIKATAINDYAVDIPVADAVANGPIVAYALNGEEMSVRDKGPLWVVYPYDSNAGYQSEVIYARSIWQLDRMTVER